MTYRNLTRRLFASYTALAVWGGARAFASDENTDTATGETADHLRLLPGTHENIFVVAPTDEGTDDGPNIQSILDDMSVPANIMLPPAPFMARSEAAPSYFFANTRRGTYPSIKLNKSHVIFDGFGARLRAKGRTEPSVDDIQPVIATAKNLAVGTLVDVGFLGIAFDTNNDGDEVNSNQRAPYLMGIDGLKFLSTICLSTGARRGSGPYLHNNRNIQIIGHRHQKVTSGGNRRYNENMVEVGGLYCNYSEAIDLDGINWQVVLDAMIFESINRISQALDANSVVNGVFANMAVKLTGQFINVNHKNTTPPNFVQYVVAAWAAATAYTTGEKATNDSGKEYIAAAAGISASAGGPTGKGSGIVDGTVVWDYVQQNPSTATPSQRVIVSNIVGEQIGSTTNPVIAIGVQWNGSPHPGTRCEHDITLNNFMFEDTSYIHVNEASNLTLDSFYLGDVIVPATAAAIHMTSAVAGDDQLAWSDLDAVVKYGTVRTSGRGILRANSPRRVVIDHLRGSNLQTLAGGEADLHFTALHTRGAYIEIDGIDIPGNITINGDSTAIKAWSVSTAYVRNKIVSNGGRYYRCTTSGISAETSGPATTAATITDGTCVWEWMPEPYRVFWGRHNQMRGALTLQGDVHKYIHGENIQCLLPDIAATGTITRVLYLARRRCYIARAMSSIAANVAADAVNFRNVSFKSQRPGGSTTISSITTIAGWRAFTQLDGGFSVSEPGAALEIGDVLYMDSTAAGTGAALTGMCISLEVLEY